MINTLNKEEAASFAVWVRNLDSITYNVLLSNSRFLMEWEKYNEVCLKITKKRESKIIQKLVLSEVCLLVAFVLFTGFGYEMLSIISASLCIGLAILLSFLSYSYYFKYYSYN